MKRHHFLCAQIECFVVTRDGVRMLLAGHLPIFTENRHILCEDKVSSQKLNSSRIVPYGVVAMTGADLGVIWGIHVVPQVVCLQSPGRHA